jgi:hypothetical protein
MDQIFITRSQDIYRKLQQSAKVVIGTNKMKSASVMSSAVQKPEVYGKIEDKE